MTAKCTYVNVCCDATRSVKCMLFALRKVLELHIIHEADIEWASGTIFERLAFVLPLSE